MNKISLSLTLLLATSTFVCTTADSSANEANKYPFQYAENSQLLKDIKQYGEQSKQQEQKQEQVESNVGERPNYNISLSDDVQDYLWTVSNKSNFSYTMLLALGMTESKFNINAISQTGDIGLFQIRPSTADEIASMLGIRDYNLKNPFTNIDFMISYLSYIRDYWNQKGEGISDEQLFDLMIISYHRGIEGSKRFIRSRGYNDPYLLEVKKNKEILEVDN